MGFPTILNTWKNEGWVKPELIEDTNLNQVTLVMKMEERENENVIDISEEQIKRRLPEYSKKKVAKAYEIVRMISENPKISIKEKCRKALYFKAFRQLKIIEKIVDFYI